MIYLVPLKIRYVSCNPVSVQTMPWTDSQTKTCVLDGSPRDSFFVVVGGAVYLLSSAPDFCVQTHETHITSSVSISALVVRMMLSSTSLALSHVSL